MATHLDTRPSVYYASLSQWPDKMLHTYLWALGIDADSCTSREEPCMTSGRDSSFFAADISPVNGTISSVANVNMAEHSSYSREGRVKDASDRRQKLGLLTPPRLRHSASCDVALQPSLPSSPRQPRLVSRRSHSSFAKIDHMIQKDAHPLEASLGVPSKTGRGLMRLPVISVSAPPTIVLSSPSSPCPSHCSLTSLSSSGPVSDCPSEPISSHRDECESTSESSDASVSHGYRENQRTTMNHEVSASASYDRRRTESRPRVRIVTVAGVDFEMAPVPVAWDHGSFKE